MHKFISGSVFGPILILVSLSFASAGNDPVNFTQCEVNFFNGSYDLIGAVELSGNPVFSLNQTQGLRYPQCESICGNGWQRHEWSEISAGLAAWLFPWLVLVSQLPFQTDGIPQDIFSAFLVIGSPIIAMYILFTHYPLEFEMDIQQVYPKRYCQTLRSKRQLYVRSGLRSFSLPTGAACNRRSSLSRLFYCAP